MSNARPDEKDAFAVLQELLDAQAEYALVKAGSTQRMHKAWESARALLERKQPSFQLGACVLKKSGSAWSGRIVGTYSTALTPEGYAVESDAHPGSVQIYPASALAAPPASLETDALQEK
jgi:hypothetical protein